MSVNLDLVPFNEEKLTSPISNSSNILNAQNTANAKQSRLDLVPLDIVPFDQKKEETIPHKVVRNIARTVEKVGLEAPIETAEGIASIAKSISPLDWIMKTIGVSELSPEQLGELKKRVNEYNINVPGVSEPLFSSEGIKKTSKSITGEYLEPQSELEESWDEAMKTTSTMLYGPKITKGKVLRAGVGGFGGEAAKKGVEAIGGEGMPAEAAKFAVITLASLTKPGGAKKVSDEFYDKADKTIPSGLHKAEDLKKDLNKIIEELEEGAGEELFSNKKGIAYAKQLKSRIKNGKLSYKEAWKFKKQLNEGEASLYKEGADSKQINKAKENLEKIRGSTKKFLSTSKESNPDFFENMTKGDEVYGAIEESKFISNWVKKKLPVLSNDTLFKAIFSSVPAGLSKLTPLSIPGAVGGYGAVIGIRVAKQMRKSPILRKYYIDLFKNAAKQDISAFANSYNKFKKQFEKIDEEEE